MRLGRKLAEGVAVDREAERQAVTEPREQQVRASAPIVTAADLAAEDVPAERPARV